MTCTLHYNMADAATQLAARHIHLRYDALASLLSEAVRVAHDVSSPIATIEMCLFTLADEIHTEKLVIMKSALQNVRDISSKLLASYRIYQAQSSLNSSLNGAEPCSLSGVRDGCLHSSIK